MNKTEKMIVKKAVRARQKLDLLLDDKNAPYSKKRLNQGRCYGFYKLVEELGLEKEYNQLLKDIETGENFMFWVGE